MYSHARLCLATFVALTAACGGAGATLDSYSPAAIDTPDHLRDVSNASAAFVGGLYAGIGQNPSTGVGTCPVVHTDGNTTTVSGGCTDAQGNTFAGSYTTVHDPAADSYETHLNGFTSTTVRMCTPAAGGAAIQVTESSTTDGTVRASSTHAMQGSFHVEITSSGNRMDGANCVVSHQTGAVIYDGTWTQSGGDTNMDGRPDRSTWNGNGRVGASVRGVVSAHTTDEVLDGTVCSHEALSGTTQIDSGGHTAVITYDGATDCTQDATVTWTYDGSPRGIVSGVSCGVAHRARGGRSMLVMGLAVAVAAIARRRRARMS